MNQATLRIVFWVLGLSFLLAAATCPAEAQTTEPTGNQSSDVLGADRPLVCINGWVSDNQAEKIIQAANELDWRIHWAEKNEIVTGCSVTFIRGDADTWLHGRFLLYTFNGMSRSKALRVLNEWTYRQNITAQCCVNESCVDC